MMKRALVAIVTWLAITGLAPVASAATVGEVVSLSDGTGTIKFSVAETVDPATAADQITSAVQLSNGAQLQSVEVKDGIATLTFANATPGASVTATLPAELVASLGIGGATTLAGGSSGTTGMYVGAGVLAATGGTLGGLAASGQFSGTNKQPVGSLAQ